MAASPGAAVGGSSSTRRPRSSGPRAGEQVCWSAGRPTRTTSAGMIAADGHPHRRGGKTCARRGGRPRHGQDLRVRRRGARRRRRGHDGRRVGDIVDQRGRRDHHRRVHRRGVPRRRAGGALAGGDLPRGRPGRGRCAGRRRGDRRPGRARSTGCWPTPTRRRRLRVRANADTAEDAARARQPRRAGHRAVPHRAHVPRRPPGADRAGDPGRRRRGARRRRWRRCCRCSATTSSSCSRRWTGCR